MSFTLADARTFLKDRDASDNSARGLRVFDKIINDSNSALHAAGNFDFDRRRGRLVFAAVYTTGTLAVNVDGTAVTGTGTAFASTDVGKYIRFDGEETQYEITAYTSGTSIAIEAYRGSANLTVATFEMTQERVALPSRFREFEKPELGGLGWRMLPATLSEILLWRMATKQTADPAYYAIDWVKAAATTVKAPYMIVHPSPSVKRVIDFPYFEWPADMTAAGDDFGLPDTPSAERLVRNFLIAFELQYQGKLGEFTTQLQYAQNEARRGVGLFRGKKEGRQRAMWNPHSDMGDQSTELGSLAAGEPVYE